MKIKKTYQLLIFIFLSSSIIAQNNFYIEVTPNSEQIRFLEKLESLSENKIDSFTIFEDSEIPLTRTETKLHLQIKQKNKALRLPSYRVYFNASSTYDTLTVLGISRNYDKQIYSVDGIETPSQLWIVPLIEYQQFASKKDYKKLTNILYELTDSRYKNHDQATPFNSVSLPLNENFRILSFSFYLFTCPEVYIFKNPYNSQTEITGWDIHKFIDQDSHSSYEKFPIPENLHFSFLIKMEKDSSVSDIEIFGAYKLNSNLKFIIELDNIGATYIRKGETRTFWANKKYVYNYLDDYKIFTISMDFLFRSALYNTFNIY